MTSRVVLELLLECDVQNLVFDNWYASSKLLKILSALYIPTICTVRPDRTGPVQLTNAKLFKRKERGSIEHAFDAAFGLHCVRWMDNNVVSVFSNCIGSKPYVKATRKCRIQKKEVQFNMPQCISIYNDSMGGVDMLDSAVANYRITIKGKKWWFPHMTNTIKVLLAAAWKIHRICHPEQNQTMLWFTRSVVLSYLHPNSSAARSGFWNARMSAPSSMCFTGRNHCPIKLTKQLDLRRRQPWDVFHVM